METKCYFCGRSSPNMIVRFLDGKKVMTCSGPCPTTEETKPPVLRRE